MEPRSAPAVFWGGDAGGYWAGLSEMEIVAQLGCSPGTVKSRASRAITALRQTDGPLAEALAATGALVY